MALKSCIFCHRTPLNKEHLFPDWMRPYFEADPRSAGGTTAYRAQALDRETVSEKTFPAGVPTAEVRCVCKTCNGGWMSAIEGRAKPYLAPMVKGDETELDTKGQEAISTWACLKAIVGYTLNPGANVAPADWRRYLYKNQRPPDGWFVGLTGYIGGTQAHFESQVQNLIRDVRRRDGTVTTRAAGNRIHSTILIGHLAMKIFGLRGNSISYPGADSLLSIWPASPLILLWPPPVHVDDRSIEAFIRFGFQ